MKTLLKIFCLLAFLGFSMETKAQTKEETIAWLKEKLNKYLEGTNSRVSNLKVIKIDECTISLEYDFHHLDWDGKTYHIIVEMPTNVKGVSNDGRFLYSGEYSKEMGLGGLTIYRNNSEVIRISNREDNILKRTEKALKHLETFCNKGKNETF
ncbi:hypothetical protein [Epilithonimonas xixisoli]|uniref:DUF4468 domain-containing protein n=1 Tax=Epilithonimonas xixisoli TaxID=1476462 RepID=A0A4R8IE30_9FLAO|nr:hypothetical protein [Epilithonimonas xixisoli]TDX83321.1 hypothetical protein B0I22_3401 [Epilithonimonas xixisoli]